jgi:hypothetical protein
MPYIITTERTDVAAHGGTFQNVLSRTAVAALDEARRITAREYREHVHRFMGFDTRWITESGGTIGPLPDGTVIEVRRVNWIDLGVPLGSAMYPVSEADALAAFNAR